MSLARNASKQLLSARSVHLKIHPQPASLSESREIFRVLQRFGEISTYKFLRYEYHNPVDNAALAIYRNADSAQQALDASPIRFALERIVQDGSSEPEAAESAWDGDDADAHTHLSETAPSDGIDDMLRPSPLLNRAPGSPDTHAAKPEPLMPFQQPPNRRQTMSRWFYVTVDRSRVVHQDFVERQPYWKHFSPTKSMAQEDLARVVPHEGLSDVSKRPMNHHRTPKKVLKQMSNYVEHQMPTLRKLYDEGGRGD